jgi:hypothetical protein
MCCASNIRFRTQASAKQAVPELGVAGKSYSDEVLVVDRSLQKTQQGAGGQLLAPVQRSTTYQSRCVRISA